MKATFGHQTRAPTELINDNTVTLSIVNIAHSLYCALIYLTFSWLYKEKVKAFYSYKRVWFMQRLITS